MGYHLMFFIVSFFATVAVSPGLDKGACYRQYIPAQSSFPRARCRNLMGGNPVTMGVFIRNDKTCCRRQQASGWGSKNNCKSCSSVRGILHPWGKWSNCSRTCGWGEQTRHRVCSNAVCAGVRGRRKTETRICLSKACCPVDGNWGGWSHWSGCSATCGEGLQYRTRNCSSPSPSCGGKPCRSYSRQMQRCRIRQCAIDGGWCAWSPWSTCTSTCRYNSSGTRKRSRRCECPVPQNGGHRCSGLDGEVEECSSKGKCPVNGGWSVWSLWTECSSAKCSTSPGVRLRTRKCNSPRPKYGGTCEGSEVEEKSCINLDNCDTEGFYGKWSSWSPCTFTCGSCAVKIRERKCFHIIAKLKTDVIGNPKFYCNESKKFQAEECKIDDCPDGKDPCDQYETVESYEEDYGDEKEDHSETYEESPFEQHYDISTSKFAVVNEDYSGDEDYHNQPTNKESPYYGVEGNGAESENHNFALPDRSAKNEIKSILNRIDEKEDNETNYSGDKNQNQIFDAVDGYGAGDSETHEISPMETTMDWCDGLNHVQGEDAARAIGCCDILTKGLTNDTDRARLQECFALHYKYVIGDADDMIEDVMAGRSSTGLPTCRYRGKAKPLNTICCALKDCTDWRQVSEPLQNQCRACRSQNVCQSCHGIVLSG